MHFYVTLSKFAYVHDKLLFKTNNYVTFSNKLLRHFFKHYFTVLYFLFYCCQLLLLLVSGLLMGERTNEQLMICEWR